MGPFIPKKESVNQDTTTPTRNRGRARTIDWESLIDALAPPAPHQGSWNVTGTYIYCNNCDWHSNVYTNRMCHPDAYNEWREHRRTAGNT